MLPQEKQPFQISKIGLTILLASLLLATLLAIVTINNIRREQEIIENFLVKEGQTLIRSFEAGVRTSLMHHIHSELTPLTTLVTETTSTESIAYIRIVNEDGSVVASAGDWSQQVERPTIEQILNQQAPWATPVGHSGVFELASIFNPFVGEGKEINQHLLQEHQQDNMERQVIYIGLRTTEFTHARREDTRHRLLMGGILFLLGCAGLYFLYLYQRMRVAQTTLANLQLYTENVIDSMPAGLITLDQQGAIVSHNSKAEQLLGTPGIPLDQQNISAVLPTLGQDLQQHKPLLDQPFDCPQQDDQAIPIKVSSSSLLAEGGREIGTVLILRDIGDIRAMEQQLERSRRLVALGQMATGIAHEIRNPLGTLRGFAQYFSKQFSDTDAGREYAELMISEVDRLNHTISALLQFARPRVPEMQSIKIDELLHKTHRLLEHDFVSQQINVTLSCPKDLSLEADPDLLLQVLINLLKNSMEVTPVGGSIELGGIQEGGQIRLWIQDTGHGMNKEEQDKMFDPFFTTKKTGTGLGLAVSHQIIEQHHGCFQVRSSPDQGTHIDIIFPKDK